MKTSLGAEGYEVEEAATGEAGWTQFNKVKPDLVLVDLGLPDIDGREVIKRIRGLEPARGGLTPIIVLSIRSDERGKVEALDLGADDYVTKPVGMDELNARIRAALRHRLQQRRRRADLQERRSRRRSRAPPRHGQGPGGQALAQGIRSAAHARHACRQGADACSISCARCGARATDVQYLRIYIRQLRHKIEPDPERPSLIQTESGVGYRLKVDDREIGVR